MGGLNLYGYVLNNPINLIDLLGLDPIVLQGILKIDTDGSGPSHNDPTHQNVTSGGAVNADTTPYAAAPLDLQKQGVKVGDRADVTLNGKTTSCPVQDFGPSNKGVGEVSVKQAQNMGVTVTDTTKCPVPSINGSSADIPVTVTFYPSGKPK